MRFSILNKGTLISLFLFEEQNKCTKIEAKPLILKKYTHV
ncbi:hypothetical protein HF086_000650 [Spodoptera exigua]|uniref:Uncharacterized protein n=1 Tax=Spodoptera exigua TaxID=7107 RepID=A0A922MDP8_SPOEX|nr:hypothetical protein HF086_000650 [Spodoptera exigua]